MTLTSDDGHKVYICFWGIMARSYTSALVLLSGGGRYTGYGLGTRTNQYSRMAEGQRGVPVENRQYTPKKKWAGRGVSRVVTLGFHQDYA